MIRSSSGVGLGHVAYGVHGSYYGTVDTGGVGSSGGAGSSEHWRFGERDISMAWIWYRVGCEYI